jgi:gluconate 2-dehydrogenase gamma chain
MQMNRSIEIDRRQWLVRAFLVVGATAISGCDFSSQSPGTGKLTKAQQELLSAIADTIIPATDTPGALAAGVPAQVSGMITNWASAETRDGIIGAMTGIDKLAAEKRGGKFAGLDAAARKTLLADFDRQALTPTSAKRDNPKGVAGSKKSAPVVQNVGYFQLKQVVINLFYASEAASEQELLFEPVPGKFVASLKANAMTRPYAGVT